MTGVVRVSLIAITVVIASCAREITVETAPKPRPPSDPCRQYDDASCPVDQHCWRAYVASAPLQGTQCVEGYYYACVTPSYYWCSFDDDCPEGTNCVAYSTPECPFDPYVAEHCDACTALAAKSCLTPQEAAQFGMPAGSSSSGTGG